MSEAPSPSRTGLSVHPARRDDLAQVAQLWRQLNDYHATFGSSWETVATAESDFCESLERGLGNRQLVLLVARDDERVVGYCHGIVKMNPALWCERRVGNIVSICVDPEYRSRGVGERLIEATLAAFRERGLERVETLVASQNDAALRFWSRVGLLPHAEVRSICL